MCDFLIATEIARRMVCEYGMSPQLGHLTFGRKHRQVFLGRDIGEEKNYSDQTAQMIDKELRHIVDEAYGRATELLTKNKDKLIKLAEALLEKEVLDVKQAREVVGLQVEEKPKENTEENIEEKTEEKPSQKKNAAEDSKVPPASS